jgi:hypothetical protein
MEPSLKCIESRRVSRHTEYSVAGVHVSRTELDERIAAVPQAGAELRQSKRLQRASLGMFGAGLSVALGGWIVGITGASPARGQPLADPDRFYGGMAVFGAGLGLAMVSTIALSVASVSSERRAFADYEEAARLAGQCPGPQAGR